MNTFKLYEQWEDNDVNYSPEELVGILDQYIDTATVPDVLDAAQGLTQIPGTAFYVQPVEETPLNARIALLLSALTPGVTLNESPSDAQILAAVQAVVGEVLDLRAFRDNVRNLAVDRPLATQCKQQLFEALSADAPGEVHVPAYTGQPNAATLATLKSVVDKEWKTLVEAIVTEQRIDSIDFHDDEDASPGTAKRDAIITALQRMAERDLFYHLTTLPESDGGDFQEVLEDLDGGFLPFSEVKQELIACIEARM